MGRRATGFSVRWREAKGAWYVRFSLDGSRPERCTGIRDRDAEAAAHRAGRTIYARAVREGIGDRRAAPVSGKGLDWWLSAWVEQLDDVRRKTRALYEVYAGYWAAHFGSLSELSSSAIEAYAKRRLREVRGKSVRNEMSALRKCVEYLVAQGALTEAPVVPSLKASVGGKPYEQRRRARAPELSPDECRRIIAALPLRSNRDGWLIRARFGLMYETTLRPETLDKLREGINFARRSATLTITDEDDKELYGRELPLTRAAQLYLNVACTGEHGRLLFGHHRYDPYLSEAARKVLDRRRSAIFAGQHFRSAAITHYLERTGNLPGVQYLAGHKHASTTSRYVRPSLRAARAVLGV